MVEKLDIREAILEKCKCFYVLHLYCRGGETVVKGLVEILVKFSHFLRKKCQLLMLMWKIMFVLVRQNKFIQKNFLINKSPRKNIKSSHS